ncbi:class I SAM-dependent methyltransferase [Candidatus Nitronereus thalassa]|uniref:Class I SAM-dependent methyltransferase n=1 Tax=Candidatus Nitronereus thalassa TaxID=3020898 RepID=A0ABU3KAA4_9BACT|nr:class I SAM-dependent methyltransferase [Candidatus Nitronereus thalassa]MDT7043405.1 class I SAM-dependent methyltransferase [Candidatus Nitronereus thalassa]
MAAEAAATDDALPQLLGDFSPVDVWQVHMNQLFYALRGGQLRDLYQTFAAADYRLGFALAADYVARVQQREKSNPSAASRALIIMEWGAGNGNLAACFLDHVQALDAAGTLYPRVEYILVDSSEVVLESAKANPDLSKHQAKIRFEQAQVPDLKAFADGSLDRIICNEFWNESPTKLLLRKAGDIMEEHVRPNLKETRLKDFPDWPGFIHAFENIDVPTLKGLPVFLEDIVWEREYHKIEAKDVPFRRLITDFLKGIDEEVLVPANIGAALSLNEAKRLLASDAIGLSAFDAGTADLSVLNDPEKPCYNLLGGQFSFMVNFALLEDVANQVGGGKVNIEAQKEFVGRNLRTNVMSLMDVLASHPRLPEGDQWEVDRFILKTIGAINSAYQSPYERKIEFPIPPSLSEGHRKELQQLLDSFQSTGVPDTIAYLTEEEVMGVAGKLEELGYDRETLRAVLKAPAQPVDYFHFFFVPTA